MDVIPQVSHNKRLCSGRNDEGENEIRELRAEDDGINRVFCSKDGEDIEDAGER